MSEIIYKLQAVVDDKIVFEKTYPDTATLFFGLDEAEEKVEDEIKEEYL